jgi:hypothetical protein
MLNEGVTDVRQARNSDDGIIPLHFLLQAFTLTRKEQSVLSACRYYPSPGG